MIRTTFLCASLALVAQESPKELLFTANPYASTLTGAAGTERGKGVEGNLNLEARYRFSATGSFRLRWELPRTLSQGLEARFTPGYRESRETRTWGLGLDYVHDFQPRAQNGFYLSGGLGYQAWDATYRGAETDGSFRAERTYTSRTLGLSAGLGYRFWRMHVELRALSTTFKGREALVSADKLRGWTEADKRGVTFQFVIGLR